MKNTKLFSTKNMVIMAMLAALATVIYMTLEIPVAPPHLKVNLADVPALIGGMLISPAAAIVILALRCVIHLFHTSSAGIGELIDFMIGTAMMLPFLLVYHRFQNKLSLGVRFVVAAILGVVCTIVGGIISNVILYPIFMQFVLGQPIESTEVFIAYLGSTVIVNILRSVPNIAVSAIFIPVVQLMRRQYINKP